MADKSSLMAEIEKQNMHLQDLQKITYGGGLEESRWIIPQDDRQSLKTEAPHSVVWRIAGIEHTVLQHYMTGKAENRRVRDRRGKMKQREQSREVRRLEEMRRFENGEERGGQDRRGEEKGEQRSTHHCLM